MKNIVTGVCMLLLMASCYEDKGNYSYNMDNMNEITDVTFVPGAYEGLYGKTVEFTQPFSEEDATKRIEVKLEQTLAENMENLDFTWIRTYQVDKQQKRDTLYTPGYVDLTFPVGEDFRYTIMLEVKDRNTTLSRYVRLTVLTRPAYKNSLFVLHRRTTGNLLGNVETIGDQTVVRLDAFHALPMYENSDFDYFGKSVSLASAVYFDYGTYMANVTRLCVFDENGKARVYNPFGLTPLFSPQYVFQELYDNDKDLFGVNVSRYVSAPAGLVSDVFKFVLSDDGHFYPGNNLMTFRVPGLGLQEDSKGDDKEDGGNGEHQTDYFISAGTVTPQHFLLWDEKYSRFLYMGVYDSFNSYEERTPYWGALWNPVVDAHVDFTSMADKGLSPYGLKGVYAYIKALNHYNEETAHPFFVLKNEDTNQYYLYELVSNATDDKDKKSLSPLADEETEANYYIASGKELINFTPTFDKNILYNINFSTNYLFYAKDGVVYRYNTTNGDHMALYSAPEGYTVSILKWRSCDEGNMLGDLGRILMIGLNKGNEGAVAEIRLNTAADLDDDFGTLFYDGDGVNKFGNILDVEFARVFDYQIEE